MIIPHYVRNLHKTQKKTHPPETEIKKPMKKKKASSTYLS
jgi:hypothetical protein